MCTTWFWFAATYNLRLLFLVVFISERRFSILYIARQYPFILIIVLVRLTRLRRGLCPRHFSKQNSKQQLSLYQGRSVISAGGDLKNFPRWRALQQNCTALIFVFVHNKSKAQQQQTSSTQQHIDYNKDLFCHYLFLSEAICFAFWIIV